VKSGTIFDDILVTDSLEEAQEYANATFEKKKGPEKAAFDEAEAERREREKEERERAAAEQEAKSKSEKSGKGDEEEDHDEL